MNSTPRSRASHTSTRDEEEALMDGIERPSPAEHESVTDNSRQHQERATHFQNLVKSFFAVVAGMITFALWVSFMLLWWMKERILRPIFSTHRKVTKRVKSVEFYNATNEQSLVAVALYMGDIILWNRKNDEPGRSLHVSDSPVRCVKFVERIDSFVTASDDMKIRVFRADTIMAQVAEIEAHTDFIRSLYVHPTLPYLFSSSDDMTIKCWDMEYNYACKHVMEGHVHYVMQIKINPRDTNMLASASLDRTIKIWKLGQEIPSFSLEGHVRGVNCLDFCSATGANAKPYLVSGSDDKTVKVWDLETKAVVHTLVGHLDNVTAVLFHPTLPILVSASEDGTCRFWDLDAFKSTMTLDSQMGKCWALTGYQDETVMGYDQGCVCVTLNTKSNSEAATRLKVVSKAVLNLGKEDNALNSATNDEASSV
jgi:WD40 repeat protein